VNVTATTQAAPTIRPLEDSMAIARLFEIFIDVTLGTAM
jgi:hypothetical protein